MTRREKDLLGWLPVVLFLAAAYRSYNRLEFRVEQLEAARQYQNGDLPEAVKLPGGPPP